MPKPTRTSGIALTLSLLVGASLQAQSNFDQVKVEATHVAGSVWMLEGAGGNIGVSAGPDGDSGVHFTESGVLHMGGPFFKDRFPFIDLNSGGNVAGYARNVRTVLDRIPSAIRIIPGHGALGSKAGLERFHGALLDTATPHLEQGELSPEVDPTG